MKKRFKGNTVLITGSATGLGEACSLRFSDEGANIICVDINKEENLKTVDDCRKRGVKAVSFIKDVRDPQGAAEVVSAVIKEFG
ncbi:MAG: short-chain dehydrogenase, partial [Spirochaetes bacterium]